MSKILTKNYLWFILIFAIVLAIYLLTLCPTIYLEDSAEYAMAAATLGIAHPSGYPLYVLLGKLFTFLPWGTVAWRVNLMSAFFGALTIAFLFLIIQRIFRICVIKKNTHESTQIGTQINTNNRNFFVTLLLYYLLPFSTALIFAFTKIFWSQAVVAEVYTLNTFFVAVIVWLLLVWTEKRQENKNGADKILLLVVFLYGLSLANHEMMVLIAPFFLIFVIWHDWRIIKDYKFIFAAAFLFFIGISLYLYLPIRASQNPALNWGNPQSWESFKGHVLRRQYNDLHFNENSFLNTKKLPLVDGFFQEIINQFTILGTVIVLIGLVANYFKNKKTFLLLFGIFLGNGLLIILLRTAEYSVMNDYMFQVYYLPSFLIVAVWLAMGLKFILEIFFKTASKFVGLMKIIMVALVGAILVILPVSFVLNNYSQNDRSDFWALHDWAKNTLLSLEKDALLLAYNDQPALDSMTFALMNLQTVEKIRPDVKIINTSGIKGVFYVPVGPEMEDLNRGGEQERRDGLVKNIGKYAKNEGGKPFYILFPLGQQKEGKWATRSNGFAYKVYENLAAAKKAKISGEPRVTVRNTEYSPLEYNLFYSDFISDYYYAQAGYYLEAGDKDLSQKLLVMAIKYDASPFSFNYQAFIEHRALWNGESLKNNKK
jgi:hypothetical protein